MLIALAPHIPSQKMVEELFPFLREAILAPCKRLEDEGI